LQPTERRHCTDTRQLSCDFIDNYARSIPANVEMSTVGSVVDADIFANATRGVKNETLVLFDFQTQVQQFISLEKERGQRQLPVRLRKVDEWTIFTVFFGIWDLLEYSTLEKETAIHAIDGSVEELMRNLDNLADHVNGPVKVVMPTLVDVTFLPRYSRRKYDSATQFAQNQHQAVFMWTYWNTAMSRAAKEWVHGDLFVPNLHGMIVNQVRAKQLYSKQISDATGWGKQMPLFDEVEKPCLGFKTESSADGLQAAASRCSNPANHLFWQVIRQYIRIVSDLTSNQGRYTPQWASPRANRSRGRSTGAREQYCQWPRPQPSQTAWFQEK
jgi:hypothetical protein